VIGSDAISRPDLAEISAGRGRATPERA